jgi:hypothetical protein
VTELDHAVLDHLKPDHGPLASVDLYRVSLILSPHFPDHSLTDLARKVAEVAVESGCRYLIWEPEE